MKPAKRRQGVDNLEDYRVIADKLGAMREIASKATKLTGNTTAASNGRKPSHKAKSAG